MSYTAQTQERTRRDSRRRRTQRRPVANQPDVPEWISEPALPVGSPRPLMILEVVQATLRAGVQSACDQAVRIVTEDFHPRRSNAKPRGALPTIVGRLAQEEWRTPDLQAGNCAEVKSSKRSARLYHSTAFGVSSTASITEITGLRTCDVMSTILLPDRFCTPDCIELTKNSKTRKAHASAVFAYYIFSELPAFRRRVVEHTMGLFCVNFHFRTTDHKAVSEALDRRGIRRYRVVPANSGWTSVYEEQASEQDDRRIRDLAGSLSENLHVPAIAFMVHDSDIACYWLLDNGQLLDEYNSDPGYFDNDTDGPPSPSGGRADVLVRYCRPGVRQDELAAMLAEETVRATTFAEDVIRRLAKALGIDGKLAIADYRDVASDHGPGELGGRDDDDDDDDGGLSPLSLQASLAKQWAKRFGFVPDSAASDPQRTALVQAARARRHGRIGSAPGRRRRRRWRSTGSAPRGQVVRPGSFFPAGHQIPPTHLLAAVVHKERAAAVAALMGRGGSEPRPCALRHPVARSHGSRRRGTTAVAHRARGGRECPQLPGAGRRMLAAIRAGVDRLVQMQAAMRSMGRKPRATVQCIAAPGRLGRVRTAPEGARSGVTVTSAGSASV